MYLRNFNRKLDNMAKIFSLDKKRDKNIFRLTVILKKNIDKKLLEKAVNQTLEEYPFYRVKLKTGFFWNYFGNNSKKPIIDNEKDNININNNNEYLFKVSYNKNRITLEIHHVLTDGIGAVNLLKSIVHNYINLKYKYKSNNIKIYNYPNCDHYINNVDKSLKIYKSNKKAFIIKDKSNLSINKTFHYTLNLEKFKNICKKMNVSITEYITSIYMYAIYRSLYNINSNKDIIVTIPINLRKHYNIQSLSNFFVCTDVSGNVIKNENLQFEDILSIVHSEFKEKLSINNIKNYLTRDVKLGTNFFIKLTPLFIKKLFIKYTKKFFSNNSTTTLSNIGKIEFDNQYKRHIKNIFILVNTNKIQKIKCTICTFENNLNITLNSNLNNSKLEDEFYNLLNLYIGDIKLITSNI